MPVKRGEPINLAPEPKKYVSKCAECGCPVSSYTPLPSHLICETCKNRLPPLKVLEHAVKAVKAQAEEKGY